MDRKTSYKHSPTSEVAEIRDKKREEEIVLRKQRRKNVVFSKRARCEEENTVSSTTFTVEQVGSIGLDIQVIGSDHLELLKQLKKAFAEDLANIDAFLSIDGAFQSLISLLTCNNPGLQLEASWCITNIAAGKTDHAMLALKHASPYLIVYLQGHSAPLQDQCSWALGNIACEGPEFREILIKQGAIQPLINLLQSPIPRVIQSAAFAISNFISGPDADISIFMNGGIAPLLLQHVNSEFDNLPVLAEIAWVLMYAMASGEFEELLISHDAIPKLVSVTCLLASAD
ncbi:uncharacterized protein [Antedon mediterranea]|uniref:uncharacterized protein n=1 Tax=Antedon mediterranea TaxID=105859 RepID=UPI003AF99B90